MNALRHTEQQRLAALHRYRILDTPPEESFDAIVGLAARICNAPIAVISLVDEAREWFKARVGVELEQASREVSFCAYAIGRKTLFVVPDALSDARFRDNPLVTGAPQIRFYAAVPLITSDGYALGALCIIDRKPREGLDTHERDCLTLLARETMVHLDLRRAGSELDDTQRVLADANFELEAFSGAVAHDLRAPVRHALGFLDLLEEECAANPPASQYAARIRTACLRMRDIIDALLRLSRAEHAEMDMQTTNLSAIVTDAASELRAAEPARQVQIAIEPGVTARADPGLLRIVLVNLLSNAWKAVRTQEAARIEFGRRIQNGRAEYFVRDNGAGFDPASQALLPAKAFARRSESSGVGLGLTLVERVVHRHGGVVRAEGAPGKGATFSFTLT